jgi:hypothetical protein
MGPSSLSLAAEAHLLLHGPDRRTVQPNTRLRRESRAQLASSPRFTSVSSSATLALRVQLDSKTPIQALTGGAHHRDEDLRRPDLAVRPSITSTERTFTVLPREGSHGSTLTGIERFEDRFPAVTEL